MATTTPIRGDLYGPERLEAFAAELARAHHLRGDAPTSGGPVLRAIQRSGATLLASVRTITRQSRAGLPISPAAEWLVDNYPTIEAQVAAVRNGLSPAFYRALPQLADGPFAGFPRFVAVVWAYVEHTDARFELAPLQRFLVAYQRVRPLAISELWATGLALRFVFVENLRRLADRILARRAARQEADALADALLDPARSSGAALRYRLWRLDRRPLSGAFTVQLIQRLRGTDPTTGPGLPWLEQALVRAGTTLEDAVLEEHRMQASIPGPVRDAVNSLRALEGIDWGDFVEAVGRVDAILRSAGAGASDFATRDRYRHVVEALARGSGHSEEEVAEFVVGETRATGRDPGHGLVGLGRRALERRLGYRPTWGRRLARLVPADPTAVYLAALAVTTGAVLAVPLALAHQAGAGGAELALFGALGALPATEVATAWVHRVVCRTVEPHRLPKLALEDGVPAALRTLVAVPALLTDEAEVAALVDRLEVHFLANDDGALHFALLSDVPDADEASSRDDEALHTSAVARVAVLNARHGPAPGGGARFFVLHRRRLWNATEGRWMGWERKRGKLRELDRLLRGAVDTSFLGGPGGADPAALAALAFRYVVTLDADTRLPRGAAKVLVGAAAHPLNAPVHDPVTGRVVAGYGILQPRVTPTLPAVGQGTGVRWVATGITGLDPYASAVSDVYQDLFGEGSFTGKGIYDVDAFERALGDHLPDNAILSHDLLEGLYARAGLLSDVELFDDPPSDQQVSDARAHRWARGDWQLLPWIFGASGLPLVGRFKMLDNLRRTLLAPATLATLLASWFLPPDRAALWTVFGAAMATLPILVPTLVDALPVERRLLWRSALTDLGKDLTLGLVRGALELVLLAGAGVADG